MGTLKDSQLHSLFLVTDPHFSIFILKVNKKFKNRSDPMLILHSNFNAEQSKEPFNFHDILKRAATGSLSDLFLIIEKRVLKPSHSANANPSPPTDGNPSPPTDGNPSTPTDGNPNPPTDGKQKEQPLELVS